MSYGVIDVQSVKTGLPVHSTREQSSARPRQPDILVNNHMCPTGLPPGQPIVVGQLVADISKPQYRKEYQQCPIHMIGRVNHSTHSAFNSNKEACFQPSRSFVEGNRHFEHAT